MYESILLPLHILNNLLYTYYCIKSNSTMIFGRFKKEAIVERSAKLFSVNLAMLKH